MADDKDRENEVLRRMLKTPPAPFTPKGDGKSGQDKPERPPSRRKPRNICR